MLATVPPVTSWKKDTGQVTDVSCAFIPICKMRVRTGSFLLSICCFSEPVR